MTKRLAPKAGFRISSFLSWTAPLFCHEQHNARTGNHFRHRRPRVGGAMIVHYDRPPRKPIPSQPIHTMSVWQQVSKGWIIVAHTDSLP